MSDLHAFVGCVGHFAHMEEDEPSDKHLPMMMNTPPKMQPVTRPLGPCGQLPLPSMGLMQPPSEEALPEEPKPKRQRFTHHFSPR